MTIIIFYGDNDYETKIIEGVCFLVCQSVFWRAIWSFTVFGFLRFSMKTGVGRWHTHTLPVYGFGEREEIERFSDIFGRDDIKVRMDSD